MALHGRGMSSGNKQGRLGSALPLIFSYISGGMKILGVAQNIPTDIQYGRYFQEAPAHLLGLNRFLGGASALMGNSWRLLHCRLRCDWLPEAAPSSGVGDKFKNTRVYYWFILTVLAKIELRRLAKRSLFASSNEINGTLFGGWEKFDSPACMYVTKF